MDLYRGSNSTVSMELHTKFEPKYATVRSRIELNFPVEHFGFRYAKEYDA